MVAMIIDPVLEETLIKQRQFCGGDRYDEVWEGVYMMSPNPNNEHMYLVMEIASMLKQCGQPGIRIFPGLNISDRAENWNQNYRCPDIAAYLDGNPAEDRDTYMLGGPDLAVEIISRGDRSREKLDFYSRVNTREFLIIDRFPWKLELYRHDGDALKLVGLSTVENSFVIQTQSVPLSWRLLAGEKRPSIVIQRDDKQWNI